jgi:hypothetical protein
MGIKYAVNQFMQIVVHQFHPRSSVTWTHT